MPTYLQVMPYKMVLLYSCSTSMQSHRSACLHYVLTLSGDTCRTLQGSDSYLVVSDDYLTGVQAPATAGSFCTRPGSGACSRGIPPLGPSRFRCPSPAQVTDAAHLSLRFARNSGSFDVQHWLESQS